MDDEGDDETFAQGCDHLMSAIECLQAAGLTNDEIRKELDARL